MEEEHTTLNEEKLTQLIRDIFQEEFKKQEVHKNKKYMQISMSLAIALTRSVTTGGC